MSLSSDDGISDSASLVETKLSFDSSDSHEAIFDFMPFKQKRMNRIEEGERAGLDHTVEGVFTMSR